jgi:EAL domain-containing protein (putative c-di-GMP-specific phosphodiesterase class I)
MFEKEQFDSVMTQLNVEMDLRGGLERGEFVVYYQPIIELSSNKITSLEALVRWLSPDKGIIPPGNFIPVAEENGLIIPLGNFILHSACDQIQKWQNAFGDAKYPTVCLNISVKQLNDPKNVDEIIQIFESYNLSPGSLKLEVTESIIMDNSKYIIKQLYKLREKGFELSIDDFGTGYSSLRYLHTFPFNYLKIDRSFISRVNFDEKTLKLVESIIHIAHDMGMKAVAEGIETENELEILRELKCDFGQGFYFSKPVPASDITRLVVTKTSKIMEDNELETDILPCITKGGNSTFESTVGV